jgi:hypothetical protein
VCSALADHESLQVYECIGLAESWRTTEASRLSVCLLFGTSSAATVYFALINENTLLETSTKYQS